MELQDLDPDVLLSRMTELGVRLRAEGDSLCYDAPQAVATPELLAALRKHQASLLSIIKAGEKAGVERRGPATYQQSRYLGFQGHDASDANNVATRLTFRGPLNVTALRAALSALLARHEQLRTRYVQAGGQWWQEVLPARPADLTVHDLTSLARDAQDADRAPNTGSGMPTSVENILHRISLLSPRMNVNQRCAIGRKHKSDCRFAPRPPD